MLKIFICFVLCIGMSSSIQSGLSIYNIQKNNDNKRFLIDTSKVAKSENPFAVIKTLTVIPSQKIDNTKEKMEISFISSVTHDSLEALGAVGVVHPNSRIEYRFIFLIQDCYYNLYGCIYTFEENIYWFKFSEYNNKDGTIMSSILTRKIFALSDATVLTEIEDLITSSRFALSTFEYTKHGMEKLKSINDILGLYYDKDIKHCDINVERNSLHSLLTVFLQTQDLFKNQKSVAPIENLSYEIELKNNTLRDIFSNFKYDLINIVEKLPTKKPSHYININLINILGEADYNKLFPQIKDFLTLLRSELKYFLNEFDLNGWEVSRRLQQYIYDIYLFQILEFEEMVPDEFIKNGYFNSVYHILTAFKIDNLESLNNMDSLCIDIMKEFTLEYLKVKYYSQKSTSNKLKNKLDGGKIYPIMLSNDKKDRHLWYGMFLLKNPKILEDVYFSHIGNMLKNDISIIIKDLQKELNSIKIKLRK
jgi:hypothetical protein